MKKATKSRLDPVARADVGQRILIPALVAVGGSLAIAPASALELSDIKVHSTLGQPLRASIAYALAPNEALSDTCVSLQPGLSSGGLPSVSRASLIVANGVIAITGSSLVREPLMTLRVNVRCPYTPNLSREYMLMVDPAGRADTAVAPAVAATPIASRPAVSAPVAAPARSVARQRPVNTDPISDTTRYQVQPGDSLSEIAQRVENRPVGLWSTVNAIFDANPGAFLDGDPNKLKAGSWLDLPDFAAADAPSVAPSIDTVTATAAATVIEDIDPVADSAAYEPAASAMSEAPMADLQPGDVILDSDNPFVTRAGSADAGTTIIPETVLDAADASSTSPNVPVAVIQTSTAAEPSTTNWFLWFVGGGMTLIAGLFLFGRFGNRFGSTPISAAVVAPTRRPSDGDSATVETIAEPDFVFPDEAPLPGQLELDADLIVGTGLQEGTDVDIAQDFAFAATTTVDFDLPEEMSSGDTTIETDIIAPVRIDTDSILESEVLPEDDDYDMSVIVDATKMPHPDDVTERDFEAIQMDTDDDSTLITNDYTVSQEVDYKILEQDYEDEMTATQALNVEISKASAELSARLDEDQVDATAEMPLATVTELDVTAQLPATNDEIGDADDTGINPTVDIDGDNNTVEMPRGDNEKTVEMEVEPGKVDTKTG
ncbi:MAG: LysM peptidoglycan-binding domain-containing protein [Gammaproteobacteria bacterium]|nr:LysM peptidoglycan-binding domain-containing protein [Gammaproteobacteria bacterium]MDH3416198.1 LysM peptidoglycan-binding domain-containing protein [Gammaproteobacteria bacterium]